MAKQREETYAAIPDVAPHCVVTNCLAPVIAEVEDAQYSVALEMFRGIHRQRVRTRRVGDERFFVCRDHLERDQRMARLHWQSLMF
jgi:hypothetical protein